MCSENQPPDDKNTQWFGFTKTHDSQEERLRKQGIKPKKSGDFNWP